LDPYLTERLNRGIKRDNEFLFIDILLKYYYYLYFADLAKAQRHRQQSTGNIKKMGVQTHTVASLPDAMRLLVLVLAVYICIFIDYEAI
jgi:hypothetical protein